MTVALCCGAADEVESAVAAAGTDAGAAATLVTTATGAAAADAFATMGSATDAAAGASLALLKNRSKNDIAC